MRELPGPPEPISLLGIVAAGVAAVGRHWLPDPTYVAVRPYVERALGFQEPELGFLMRRARGRIGRRFIDVGANWGSYSVLLGPRFDRVDAFEPLPRCAAALGRYASHRNDMTVHACALSDRDGRVLLTVPKDTRVDRSGRARIGDSEAPGESALAVEARTLDSFAFDDVDLIKVDVEGHERSVLTGASETIRRCRPTLLVEIEQRHSDEPFKDRLSYFEGFGYHASFLKDGDLVAANAFEIDRDQNLENLGRRSAYINNFLFEAF
jgi:FkbM family methyltransferase